MCGIFGIAACGGVALKRAADAIRRFCLLSESRGKDASGLVFQDDDGIHLLKRPVRGRVLLASAEFASLACRIDRAAERALPFFAMGHTRMVTNGDADNHANNQPVVKDGLVCIHNGIVTNESELWRRYDELSRVFEVDTEVIVSLVGHFRRRGDALPRAAALAFAELEGANSLALTASDFRGAVLATSNGSLYTVSGGGVVAFASERYILRRAIESSSLRSFLRYAEIEQIEPKCGCVIAMAAERLEVVSFSLESDSAPAFSLNPTLPSRRIEDMSPPSALVERNAPVFARSSFKELEELCRIDTAKIDSLRRCSRCLLPETFPFIAFDEEGVCNYCANYSPWRSKGVESLERLVAPMRKGGGEPDCLVPVSGGRDSSYALHFVKNVLGMNPVAYTYDWGMVTDLARRNISRMCGALGVEHILVSADIAKKRANVRKNVLAWLKKPHLGTVTLFMAGDKHYFYYERMLRRQMNLPVSFLGMNALERTDFKTGFCGVRNTADNRAYELSISNKFRMLLFFAGKFLSNSAFINSSVIDTFKGYLSYYFIPQDFISIYDYISWDEETIADCLVSGYGWELDPNTRTTWRIGDGTAAFYNYIYFRCTGFSEYDTFRSNQIRQGLLSREIALESVKYENIPRVESIKWYCDAIGVDPIEAIRTINQMTPLYA